MFIPLCSINAQLILNVMRWHNSTFYAIQISMEESAMSLAETITKHILALPESKQAEVLDFVEYLCSIILRNHFHDYQRPDCPFQISSNRSKAPPCPPSSSTTWSV